MLSFSPDIDLETAEDLVQDAFTSGLKSWMNDGIPGNPLGWIFIVCRNKALNEIKKRKRTRSITANDDFVTNEVEFSESVLEDQQLKLVFACAHPDLSPKVQVVITLKYVVNLKVEAIAKILGLTIDGIDKLLVRARQKIRDEQLLLAAPTLPAMKFRLPIVHKIIYLLFNEGYYSTSGNTNLRKDLCLEAMRLTYLLVENAATDLPQVNALFSLMCFHASRFEARIDKNGDIIIYDDQDSSLWNEELISRGTHYLIRASTGNQLTRYHLEAAIAYWHTQKADTVEKWENVLQLYNKLLILEYSPMAALNRTYALAKADGKEKGIVEAEKLTQLTGHHLYHSLMGYLYKGIDNYRALQHLQMALKLAKTSQEKNQIRKSIGEMEKA